MWFDSDFSSSKYVKNVCKSCFVQLPDLRQVKLGYPSNHFTFRCFRRSAATFAYNSHILSQHIKQHGTWVSDGVWSDVQKDHELGEDMAFSMAAIFNNA